MGLNGVTIGLVLSNTPAYSETFFRSKIAGLTARGASVIVFAKGASNGINAKVVAPWPARRTSILTYLLVPAVVTLAFVSAPAVFVQFWRLERQQGKNVKSVLQSIYLNAHILPRKVDWLHFGFAALTIGRENVAKAMRAKMSVSFRGFDIMVFPLNKPKCYNHIWTKLDKVHSISAFLLAEAVNLGMPAATNAVIISPAIHEVAGRASGILASPIRIVTVARLHWIKGLEYALIAMQQLVKRQIDFTYEIIGEGEERERLVFEVNNLNLSKQVSLLGKRSHHEALHCIASCDIYLQPSLMEGFCNAVLEAQVRGRLCIVSAVGGMTENVVDGVTGWAVPPRDGHAIAEKIMSVVTLSNTQRETISRQAMERVRKNYTLHDQADKWEQFFQP